MGELREFVRKALDLAINWQDHDEKTLGDLVERMRELDVESQELVWQQIEKWAASNTEPQRQVLLRERIRKFALTRRASVKGLPTATRDRATEIYEKLAPTDPVLRHLWLFEKFGLRILLLSLPVKIWTIGGGKNEFTPNDWKLYATYGASAASLASLS